MRKKVPYQGLACQVLGSVKRVLRRWKNARETRQMLPQTCFRSVRKIQNHNGHTIKYLLSDSSLRGKRFQSSYCAKVRAEANKKVPFPLPRHSLFFFALVPAFYTNLARKRLLRRLVWFKLDPRVLSYPFLAPQGQVGENSCDWVRSGRMGKYLALGQDNIFPSGPPTQSSSTEQCTPV